MKSTVFWEKKGFRISLAVVVILVVLVILGNLVEPTKNKTDQALTADEAIKNRDQVARIAAIEKLTDARELEITATREKDYRLRLAAVKNKNLIDQIFLAQVARNERIGIICVEAIEKLTPDHPLQQILRAKAADVFNNSDQKQLTEIARICIDSVVGRAAVEKVKDPVLLAKIATESWDSYIRNIAIDKLTDQALLEGISRTEIESELPGVRAAAVAKLTNQKKLAMIAETDRDADVRREAVEKLTNQTVLAKVAVEDKNIETRNAAIEKLTDQAVLAKLAAEDEDEHVRAAAVEKLTNQQVLAKLAIEHKDWGVRYTATEKLTDATLLSQVAISQTDPTLKIMTINYLKNSDPVLWQIAGKLTHTTQDARECFARLKLATQESAIRLRFPVLDCIARAIRFTQEYSGWGKSEMPGEDINVKLIAHGNSLNPLAEAEWATVFPEKTRSLAFTRAEASGTDLLTRLLQQSAFTQNDLAELANSKIPEVRLGAVANITDQAILAKVAVEDKDENVREAAKERLAKLRR